MSLLCAGGTLVGFRPFPVPIKALGVRNTRRSLDIQTAQDLLNRALDPVHC